MSPALNRGFELLDMLRPDGEVIDNLIQVHYSGESLDYDRYDFESFHVDKIIALESAARYKADFVYFRTFPERPPIPQIYIYNYVGKKFNGEESTDLHRKLWSAVQVPMFFIFTETEIKIFNAFEAPVVGKRIVSKALETIHLAAFFDEKASEFSAKKFDNGMFWESSSYAGNFKFSGSAYEQLLVELKNTLKDIVKSKFDEDEKQNEKIAKKLLIRAILVKYLEERKDESGKTVFPKKGESRQYENGQRKNRRFERDFFDDFADGATCFTDILEKRGACVKFFEYLSKHFNGEIFKLDAKEVEALQNANLSRLSEFLKGKLKGRQYSLFELYSFNDLPVELISNVYEEFLESKPGVVYTPPYLVNFLLEEAMPLDDNILNFKILDPACGSGVFLVGAYKRLIYRWRANNGWRKPSKDDLKGLLKNNIFGVDEMEEAVNLSMFSLSLALCDELSPIAIWDELKFDNLKGSNLFDNDFFELIEENALPKDFNLVIGNPPFKPEFSPAANRLEAKRIEDKKERKVEIEGKIEKIKIPGNQIALLFLDQAIQLCKPNGLLCLILPSTDFLYNHNSDKFRTYFLTNYHTPQILDFTNLSGCLFGNANVSVIALFSQNKKPENLGAIRHITVRRNQVAEERIFFELDYYDFQSVPFDDTIGKSFTWKANLLGGGRLGRLISRLSRLKPTLGEYLKSMKLNHGWNYGEGYTIGNRERANLRERLENDELPQGLLNETQIEKLKKDFKPASWLTGKYAIDADSINGDGIRLHEKFKLKQKFFYRNAESKKEIFQAPHILLKEVISGQIIPVEFLEKEYLAFDDRLTGIYAPESQKQKLLELYSTLKNNRTYVFFTACTSSEFAVSRATALQKKDIDNLPYPYENLEKLKLSSIEEILRDDTLNYWLGYSSGIKTNLPLFGQAEKKDLEKFSKIFCEILNSVYEDFHSHQPIETDNFICFPFFIGNKPSIEIPEKENLEKHLNQLLRRENPRANLRITRIMRVYDHNVIYLIKPKQLRYWLRSVAIRDADATFADMVAQEYQL